MPSKKQRITVYLGPDEYSGIRESAKKAGLSLSTFCQRVCLGVPVQGLEHRQAVRDILKATADLGRLGGLFKLALSSTPAGHDRLTLQRLLQEIETGQRALKVAVLRIQ